MVLQKPLAQGQFICPEHFKDRGPAKWNISGARNDLDLSWEKTDRVETLKANLG